MSKTHKLQSFSEIISLGTVKTVSDDVLDEFLFTIYFPSSFNFGNGVYYAFMKSELEITLADSWY